MQKTPIFIAFFAILACLAIPGCDRLPRDPSGTLERIKETGTLRVGVSYNPPWVIGQPDSEPTGIEATLIRQFAQDDLHVKVQWQWGSDQQHFESLRNNELDVVIGGLTRDNPWSQRVGFTLPYYTQDQDEHVIAISQGENALLMRLESFLLSHATPQHIRQLQEASQP